MWTRSVSCLCLLGLTAFAPLPAGEKDARPGKPVRLGSARIANHGRVFALAYSADGRLVAGGAWDGSIRVWQAATGKQLAVLHEHRGPVRRLAFSHDGQDLASAGMSPAVCVWDVRAGSLRTVFKTARANGTDVAFSPDDRHLAAIAGGTLSVWDRAGAPLWTSGGERTHTRLIFDDAASVTSLSSKPPKRFPDPDRPLYLAGWDVASGKELRARVLEQPQNGGGFLLGPGGLLIEHTVVEYGRREVLRCVREGRPEAEHRIELAGQDVTALCVSPDGRMLALTGDPWGAENEGRDKLIRVFEIASGQERCHFVSPDRGQLCLAFAPDGRTLASGSLDVTVLLWDLTLGESSRAPADEAALERLWEDLKGEASAAYRAQWRLVTAAKAAVPFLARRLRPVAAPDPKRLAELVRDLADERFDTRTRAEAGLSELGDLAEPALRAALPTAKGLEARRRIEALLKRVSAFSPERLAELRAVEALERIASPAARALLGELAGGYAGASLTRAAGESLRRLQKF